jgi:molecular chaperone DnaK
MGKVIGIDLGTTNSCVAIMSGGDPVVIANSGRRSHHPVHRRHHRKEVSGLSVKSPSARPSPTRRIRFSTVKRLMGRKFNEPRSAGSHENSASVQNRGSR